MSVWTFQYSQELTECIHISVKAISYQHLTFFLNTTVFRQRVSTILNLRKWRWIFFKFNNSTVFIDDWHFFKLVIHASKAKAMRYSWCRMINPKRNLHRYLLLIVTYQQIIIRQRNGYRAVRFIISLTMHHGITWIIFRLNRNFSEKQITFWDILSHIYTQCYRHHFDNFLVNKL